MQAVLPIAGKSSRMAVLHDGPKQLLSVAGKPLIEHTLEVLPTIVDELVLIVGGPHEQRIRDYFGSAHRGRKVTYVRQPEQKGLGHAIQQTQPVVHGKFLVYCPDDIFAGEDIERLVAQEDLAALAQHRPDYQRFGVFVCDDAGCVVRAVEKPMDFISDIVSTGQYLLDEEFFSVSVAPSARGEIELPDIVNALVRERGRRMRVVEAKLWLAINDPEQLVAADAYMRRRGGRQAEVRPDTRV